MTKAFLFAGALLALGFASAEPAAAQTDSCSANGGYPEGSLGAATARMRAISDGSYAACVEARRARQPVVNWTAAQIRTAGRRAVLAELRDPASAQFRNVRRIQHDNGSTMFCGEVNARNAYGGMAGFVRFEAGVTNRGSASAQLDSSETLTGTYFESAWNQFCGRIAGTSVQF